MAFDYGDVRIGVAVCDPDAILATPVTTLKNKDIDLWDQIVALVAAHPPAGIFHGTNADKATWFEFASAIVDPIANHFYPAQWMRLKSDLIPAIGCINLNRLASQISISL